MSKVVLVVGPGRAATSFVAEILYRQFRIPMGPAILGGDENNPNGYWEDLWFADLNEQHLFESMPFGAFQGVARWIIEQREIFPIWGFKDPRLSYLLGFYLQYIPDPIIIRCRRNIEDVARSSLKLKVNKERYKTFEVQKEDIKSREYGLDNILQGRRVLNLWFNERQTMETVKATLWDFFDSETREIINSDRDVPVTQEFRSYTLDYRTMQGEGE